MTALMSDAQQRAARSGDFIGCFPDGKRATDSDFGTKPAVVVIHGFTADASYLGTLMQQLDGAGFAAFSFEYACFRGIDYAGKSLVSLLSLLDANGAISANRLVLVGHSMGGLVARAAVTLSGGATYVRKVITLGTPHGGTLQDAKMPRYMAQWGAAITGKNPRGFSTTAASALQLMNADSKPTLLDRLRQGTAPNVQFYSISGGYGQLDFGRSYWKNFLINWYLQRRLGVPNDGLVSESSSDLSQHAFSLCAPGCIHDRYYVAYPHMNHSYLIDNQEVALRVRAYAA